MIFTEELWDTYAADAPPLWQEQYEEIARDHQWCPLQVDVSLYRMLEQNGRLAVLTARDSTGSLQGYAVFTLYRHPHFFSVWRAHESHYFIRKAARGPRVGLRLVQEAELMLSTRGVHEIVWHTKPWLDNERLFGHCGYAVSDILYSKRLGAS